MAYLIVAEDAIGVLASVNLPAAVGGGLNPFKDLIEFLDKTRGRWSSENDVRGGLSKFKTMISSEKGAAISGSDVIYSSPFFSPGRLPIDIIPQAMVLFDTLGLYFELIQYPCFVQLSDANYTSDTPDYLPNSRIIDRDADGVPTGTTTIVKWNEWKDVTHNHLADSGKNYIPLNSNTNSHELAGSIILQLIGDSYDVSPMSEWPVIPEV